MAQRVIIRFYRVRSPLLPAVGGEVLQDIKGLNYLRNINARNTVRQAQTSGGNSFLIITIFPDNMPDGYFDRSAWASVNIDAAGEEFEVLVDGSRYNMRYITLLNRRFYIDTPGGKYQSMSFDKEETFEFHVNPQRITPSIRKLQSEMRTRGGWEIQHWGNELEELRVEGHSGGMHKKLEDGKVVPLGPDDNVTKSIAWTKLSALKNLFYSDKDVFNNDYEDRLLAMNYYDDFYIGYFKDFAGPSSDSQSPFIINYSFTFKVTEKTQVSGNIDLVKKVGNDFLGNYRNPALGNFTG
jgi:hypothetical protein